MIILLLSAAAALNVFLPDDSFCWPHSHPRASLPVACPPHTRLSGLLCYPPCRNNYTPIGPLCWKKWDASRDLKFVYGRGVGVAAACGDDTWTGGLCIRDCGNNYTETAGVCFRTCHGSQKFKCGPGCAVDAKACQTEAWRFSIGNIVFWSNIAALVAGARGATLASTIFYPATAGTAAVLIAEKSLNSRFGNSTIQNPSVQKVVGALVSHGDEGKDIDWALFDPSGVAQMVDALYKPFCHD